MNAAPHYPADTLFLFAHGQVVRWLAFPDVAWRIVWRRYTERDIMGPLVDYRVEPVEAVAAREVGAGGWADEADLEAWPAPA